MSFELGQNDDDEFSFASSLRSSEDDDADEDSSAVASRAQNAASSEQVSIFDQKVQAKQATHLVKIFKLIVYLAILAGALIVWLAMLQWMEDSTTEWHEDELNEQTLQVFDVVSERLHTLRFGLGVLSDAYTSHAANSQAEWSTLLLPDFDVRATSIMEATSVRVLEFAPIIFMQESNQTQHESSPEELLEASQSPSINGDFGAVGGLEDTMLSLSAPVLQAVDTSGGASSPGALDMAALPALNHMIMQVVENSMSVLAPIKTVTSLTSATSDGDKTETEGLLLTPVFASFEDNSQVVGVIAGVFSWLDYLAFTRHDSSVLVIDVVDSCEGDGDTFVVGEATTHDGKHFDSEVCQEYLCLSLDTVLTQGADGTTISEVGIPGGICNQLQVQLGDNYFENEYGKNVLRRAILVAFIIIALAFLIFDFLVQRRYMEIVNAAEQTNAILSSLFPSQVHERMLEATELNSESEISSSQRRTLNQHATVKSPFGKKHRQKPKPKPTAALADFFPDVTIIFADIAGFTAWSSSRSPPQVLQLLETIYKAFDQIASTHGVFKVETIGDCYVAVCGLPEPNDNHAVVMARFARDCLVKLRGLLEELEVDLGPDTTDLAMRIGLHSGCVTAGIIRGERSRFQLFGDSMNTASRIETTGKRGRIHASQDTANRLIMHGKANWVVERKDKVVAKGKGQLNTYWINPFVRRVSGNAVGTSAEVKRRRSSNFKAVGGARLDLLVQWTADSLEKALTDVLTIRRKTQSAPKTDHLMEKSEQQFVSNENNKIFEIQEALPLPNQMDEIETENPQREEVGLNKMQRQLLHNYVQEIRARHSDHSFHSFRHASHVVLSANKLLSRVVSPSTELGKMESSLRVDVNTFGIVHPLTRFACLLSALVHSVDHPGAQEDGQSLPHPIGSAENNSIKVAWDLLMQERFVELRRVIYCNEDELTCFRQILVNSVLATDILNKEQQMSRSDRWSSAFATDTLETFDALEKIEDVRATLVIEYLSQAGYVAHAMQHWHVYIKWTERFFLEKYVAFSKGDIQTDPCPKFYEEQIEFFDNMVIPVANKLIACGAFGVVCVELLHYATDNREEWIHKGQDVVKQFLAVYSEESTLTGGDPGSDISDFSERAD